MYDENQELESEQLDALLNSLGYVAEHEQKIEDLLKTPEGIEEAKKHLQELKRQSEKIDALQCMINDAEKQQASNNG